MELNSPNPATTIRRNPPRRARPTPSTQPKPSTANPEISSFPLNEIASIELPKLAETVTTQNLKVYLRIRPLVTSRVVDEDRKVKARAKNVWPKNPVKKVAKERKRSGEVCVSVNDENSVTLSPPVGLVDAKRVKSEVYQGFSRVFSAESTQSEVYEKMVQPLVDDFLRGKSGMLAAMGPTGSGKTHTVFGCPRDPGMVPLLLRQISEQMKHNNEGFSRSFYISMFEICSEKGKGERLIDLSPDGSHGTEISMQQSSIKGLQEMAISDIREAESLIARGMLKRATANTNSNSQSSRSQCIINIHSVVKRPEEEVDVQANSAVLTIVDLAGAEREKKTGNQGARLLESNFINNTSMVFGLCLRSLFEHQKNPKKPLQKHFQNSMLTRCLRDYLEGKKRMALILTIKPGEEDYLDASFLLRQASPYMKIKFTNVEKLPNCPSNKRQCLPPAQVKGCKKMKFSQVDADADACEIEEGKTISEEGGLSPEETQTIDHGPSEPGCDDSPEIERSNQIMQKFARAIWNVLKQHNKKLQGAEDEIRSLKESLKQEKTRCFELEEELKKVKSLCTSSNKHVVEAISGYINADLVKHSQLQKSDADNIEDCAVNVKALECSRTPEKCSPSLSQDQGITSECIEQKSESSLSNQEDPEYSNRTKCQRIEDKHHCRDAKESLSIAEGCSQLELNQMHKKEDTASECSRTPARCLSDVDCGQDAASKGEDCLLQVDRESKEVSSKLDCLERVSSEQLPDATHGQAKVIGTSQQCDKSNQQRSQDLNQECESSNQEYSEDLYQTKCHGKKDGHSDVDVKENSQQSSNVSNESCSPLDVNRRKNEQISYCTVSEKSGSKLELNQLQHVKALISKDLNDVDKPERKLKSDASHKSTNAEKPKRRLLPASSVLLKNINVLDVEDENEKPKGKKGSKKHQNNDIPKTMGNTSLMRLLKSNLQP